MMSGRSGSFRLTDLMIYTEVLEMKWSIVAVGSASLLMSGASHAIAITASTDANSLANAILGSGVAVTSSTLNGHTDGVGAVSSGTFTNASGTYGIGSGVVLSTGDVNNYNDSTNLFPDNSTDYNGFSTASQEALLDPITGGAFDHFDVTQFDIVFDVDTVTESIFFNVVFGSEEFDEYVSTEFIDAFGIYLNGVNIALFNGQPVNIDHPNMAFIDGTELDGILDPSNLVGDPVMLFEGAVTPGSTDNTLTFIIADSGDFVLDSTVFLSGFGSTDPGGGVPGGGVPVPEPSTFGLLGLSFAVMGLTRKFRRS